MKSLLAASARNTIAWSFGLLCATVFGLPSGANAVPVFAFSGGCVSTSAPCVVPTAPGTTTSTASDGSSQATITATASPIASITATATSNGGLYGATAVEQLQYYIEIVGPAGPDVPLGYLAHGSVLSSNAAGASVLFSINTITGGNTSVSSINGTGSANCPNNCAGLQPGFDPASFTISNTLPAPVNTLIEIGLYAQAGASGGFGPQSATAFIDPMFFVDLADPSAYSIILSEGIGNATSATPLPTALPLFAGGLGLIGLLTRRRKQRHAAQLH